MEKTNRIMYDDLEIKFEIKNLLVNVLYFRYEPPLSDWNVKSHCHSSYELHYIPSGNGTLITDQAKFKLHPGTLYLTGPGIYHEQFTEVNNPMDEYCINFDFKIINNHYKTKSVLNNSDTDEFINALTQNNFWFGQEHSSLIETFESIIKELESKKIGYDIFVSNLLSQVIIHLVRCLTQQRISSETIPQKALDDRRRLILDWFLGGESPTLLSLEALSEKLGLSIRQLNRVIKDYYHMTYNEILLRSKLQNAKYLLKHSQMRLDDIANISGFSSSGYFCSMFKRSEGVTPTEYRNRKRTS